MEIRNKYLGILGGIAFLIAFLVGFVIPGVMWFFIQHDTSLAIASLVYWIGCSAGFSLATLWVLSAAYVFKRIAQEE
jgi:hypothetical protein